MNITKYGDKWSLYKRGRGGGRGRKRQKWKLFFRP